MNLLQPRSLIAFSIQVLFFGLFFFIDVKMTVAETWLSVVRFGLNPMVVLFFGLTPLALWWSYREIMATTGFILGGRNGAGRGATSCLR